MTTPVVRWVHQLVASRGLRLNAVARAAGLSENSVYTMRSNKSGMKTDTLGKYMRVCGSVRPLSVEERLALTQALEGRTDVDS